MKLKLGILLIAVIFFSTAHARDRGEHFEKMMTELDLTPTEKQSLTEKMPEFRQKMKELKEKKRGLRDQMDVEMSKSGNDSKLEEIHKNMKEAHSNIMDAKFKKMQFIRETLPPEKLAKFVELRKKRKGKHRHRRNHDDH